MNKREILLERLPRYCERLGCSIPKIIWTKSEFMKLVEVSPNLKLRKGLASKRTLGRCCRTEGVIYIAYQKHRKSKFDKAFVSLRELDHTLRHELIHWRFPQLDHGDKFNKLIGELKTKKRWDKFTDEDFYNSDKKHEIIRKSRMNVDVMNGKYLTRGEPEIVKDGKKIYPYLYFRRFWFGVKMGFHLIPSPLNTRGVFYQFLKDNQQPSQILPKEVIIQ